MDGNPFSGRDRVKGLVKPLAQCMQTGEEGMPERLGTLDYLRLWFCRADGFSGRAAAAGVGWIGWARHCSSLQGSSRLRKLDRFERRLERCHHCNPVGSEHLTLLADVSHSCVEPGGGGKEVLALCLADGYAVFPFEQADVDRSFRSGGNRTCSNRRLW
jgi:hypothetical protein